MCNTNNLFYFIFRFKQTLDHHIFFSSHWLNCIQVAHKMDSRRKKKQKTTRKSCSSRRAESEIQVFVSGSRNKKKKFKTVFDKKKRKEKVCSRGNCWVTFMHTFSSASRPLGLLLNVLATFNKPAGPVSLRAAKYVCVEAFWPGNGEISWLQTGNWGKGRQAAFNRVKAMRSHHNTLLYNKSQWKLTSCLCLYVSFNINFSSTKKLKEKEWIWGSEGGKKRHLSLLLGVSVWCKYVHVWV